MPRITITTLEAKTLDQKRALVDGFAEVCMRVLKVPKERVNVAIIEYPPENLATGGVLVCDKRALEEKKGSAQGEK